MASNWFFCTINMSWNNFRNQKMCRVSASKLYMCCFYIIYTKMIKNKMLFSILQVEMQVKSLTKTSIQSHQILIKLDADKKCVAQD
jgi:hypothetical protein